MVELPEPEEEFKLPELNQHVMKRWIAQPLPEEIEEIEEVPIGQYTRPDSITTIDPRTWEGVKFDGHLTEIPEPKHTTSWAWIFLWAWAMLATSALIYTWWLHGFWNFMKVQ